MEKELKLIGVNKKYKLSNKETFQALYDINVEFDKGELISIVGESGSGKSTLMNLIGGLDSDFSGTIIAGGENLGKLSDKQLDKYRKNKVGFVFQSFNLISHLSILDNVTLALTLSNMGEKERVAKATEMLKRVGLEDQLKKKPSQLSGGQKQRVAIARALINDPEIIIADEPTGALDSETSMQILQILKEIADSGKLVIMVTHSEKVASISSRVVKLSDGRIVDDIVNENYQKIEQEDTPTPTSYTTKQKGSKDKQNLSFWSAIRLSLHNMWANKVKNFLMAFGVAIGIGSLILMMSFGSGITDFITDTMTSYSDPQIVTITRTKKSPTDFGLPNFIEEDEITSIKDGLNKHLEEEGFDFRVTNENMTYGLQMMTAAKVFVGDPTGISDTKDLEESGLKNLPILYMYTTPPYYTDTNIIDGEMSDKTGGIMFSPTIQQLFGKENPVGKSVNIIFPVVGTSNELLFPSKEITAIVDTSVMSGVGLVMYIDYNYLQQLFVDSHAEEHFAPNTLYIKTDSEKTTDAINAYLATGELGDFSGSIEDSLANMFTNMTSVIGTSLSVISSISLLVSAMMILVVLYMSVTERTKEIGVLKSIGARRKDIKRIFTSESFLIGLLSGIVGILFNLLLTLVVVLVLNSTIGLSPISYRWWYFAIGIGVSVVISMLSGLYPASKAAKLDPVESLRRE